MFVRDPYHRLLSAYVDKPFVPNPMFWERFGKPAISHFRSKPGRDSAITRKCYHDVTFTEFLKFVVDAETTKEQIDGHFQKASEMCVACSMNYSFVGKMETFQSDSYDVMKHIGLGRHAEAMKTNLRDLTEVDAIRDSIDSPFHWKRGILRCMTWREALLRIWRKLQIRGLVGIEQQFPIEVGHTPHVKKEQFIQMALDARQRSDPLKLAKQKHEIYLEMYRMVPGEVLDRISSVYSSDFYLFAYNNKPLEIFGRNSPFVPKNYSDFRKQIFEK